MRRFYQNSWFGVAFSSFGELSFFHLAESRFYEQFYEALFRIYPSWDALPKSWRETKLVHAGWLAEQAHRQASGKNRPLRALSIGSGLGFIEYNFLRELPDTELHLSEPSTVGMDWIRPHIPPERVHIGAGADALPPDLRFDLIYLSAAEYFLRQEEFAALLAELRGRLEPDGRLIVLSASFLEAEGPIAALLNLGKVCIYALLHAGGVRRRQFWGWLRTREEYLDAVRKAGFTNTEEGRLDDASRTFWISGQNPAPGT